MATHEAGPQRRRFVEDVVAMNSMRPSEELRQKYGFRYDGETFVWRYDGGNAFEFRLVPPS